MPVYGSEQRCPRGRRLRGGQFKETGVADRSKVLVGGAWKGCRRNCRAASHGRSRRIGQVSRPGSCSADRGTNRRFWSRMPLNGKKLSSDAYWARWNDLHTPPGPRFVNVVAEVRWAMDDMPRASSTAGNLNSRLRKYFPPVLPENPAN